MKPSVSVLYLFVMAILIAGCSTQPTAVGPEGTLRVLAPVPGFSPYDLPRGWSVAGALPGVLSANYNGYTRQTLQGIPAIRVARTGWSRLLARHTEARLLASPFLSWSWNMEPSGEDPHPIMILVGFYGGDAKSDDRPPLARALFNAPLPAHDRVIGLVWSAKPLARGTLKTEGPTPWYVVRGGAANQNNWWLETVDLADLYQRSWPDDPPGRVFITFIGIASVGGAGAAAGNFSGILLSR